MHHPGTQSARILCEDRVRNELRYLQPGKPDQNVNIDSLISEREEIFAWTIDKAI